MRQGDDPGAHSEDGPTFVHTSAFLLNNISLAIACGSDSDMYVQDPVIALYGDARPSDAILEGVIYAEGGDQFCKGAGYDYSSSALSHGGSLVWVNSVQSTAGSFANILSYVVGCLILSVVALNLTVQMIPFLSHSRQHANAIIYSLLAGALGVLAYTVLAEERKLTVESVIAIFPLFLVVFGVIWYKEAIDLLIYKVCLHNDGDHDKVAVELEIRFDKPGWAFADWLGIKNNGGKEDLEKWWTTFHEYGCDRLDLVRDMAVEELKTNVPDLTDADAKKLHSEFHRLKSRRGFRNASMLKHRYNMQLTKIRPVFADFASQLYQGKARSLLRLMIQYAVAIQYYKSLKIHLISFADEYPRWSPNRWLAHRDVVRFGGGAKRKLRAWFRIMKDHPGRLVDLSFLCTTALQGVASHGNGRLLGKQKAQLRWVQNYHTRLLVEMLKKYMAETQSAEIQTVEKFEDETRALMRVHFSTDWPRWEHQAQSPPAFDFKDDDSDDDDNDDDDGAAPELWYQEMDEQGKLVPSDKTTLEEFQQLLETPASPVTVDTKVFSEHSDFKAIFDGTWTAWAECEFLFAPFMPDTAEEDGFENPVSSFEVEDRADDVKPSGSKKRTVAGMHIGRHELLSFPTFRQHLMRDIHATGCQPFLVESGYDDTTNLECRLIGMQTYGTLEVVSQFASDAAGDLDFAGSLLGAFVHALRHFNPAEMCEVIARAVTGLISHISAWCMAPFHQAERQELRVFVNVSEDHTTIEGPVTISNLRLRYLAGIVNGGTFIWTSEQWGWSEFDQSTGKVKRWKKWRRIQDARYPLKSPLILPLNLQQMMNSM